MCHEKLGTRGPELVKATRGVEGGSQSKSPQRDSSIGPDFGPPEPTRDDFSQP